MRSPVTEVRSQVSTSLRVATLVAIASDGSSLELSGSAIRKRLALRSTAFRLGTLAIRDRAVSDNDRHARSVGRVSAGRPVATLERLGVSGGWIPVVQRLTVQADGSFAAIVRPKQTTTYRLSASGVPGPELTIPVVAATA